MKRIYVDEPTAKIIKVEAITREVSQPDFMKRVMQEFKAKTKGDKKDNDKSFTKFF